MDLVVIITKKKLLIISIILLCITLCISACFLCDYVYRHLFFSEPNIIQSEISPDGKYTAYIYENSGGATTGWIYNVSIIESGKELNRGMGNILISSFAPDSMKWTDNYTLFIDDYDGLVTTKQKHKYKDITIKYKSLE